VESDLKVRDGCKRGIFGGAEQERRGEAKGESDGEVNMIHKCMKTE
jgi:hypothetical protein